MRKLLVAAEALVALIIASILIAFFDFRRIAAIAARAPKAAPTALPAVAGEIAWAIAAWGRRVPWRAVCFQQGLAAQFMLRRRRLAATLHYGARRDADGQIAAHVWVRSGRVDVIGCDGAEAYGLLAVFPDAK